jgi:hypothetical protein
MKEKKWNYFAAVAFATGAAVVAIAVALTDGGGTRSVAGVE